MIREQQNGTYLRCLPVMPKPNPTKFKGGAFQARTASLDADQLQRHAKLQRMLIATLGCLWLLAFATGCSRNSKNCSAYDGVDFGQRVEFVQPSAD